MNTGISTYIWVLSKDKPAHRAGKVQLIDASHCFEPRRKSIGTKRNDITDACRELIVTAYGEFANGKVYGDKNGIYCESKGVRERGVRLQQDRCGTPQRDEAGNIILKRGKPVPDTSLRDTENVPLVQDIDAYFAREVLPYAPDAWIDHSKTKVGYRSHDPLFLRVSGTGSRGGHCSTHHRNWNRISPPGWQSCSIRRTDHGTEK